MISLRLSQSEYEALRSLYPSYGARNVSDFARLAMQRVIGRSLDTEGGILSKLQDLEKRLKALESNVSLLIGRDKVLS